MSNDSSCLAFVGPSKYIVTVADTQSLDELLRIDVSALDKESSHLDCALKVCFPPASTKHLLVATSANKILWVCTRTGSLLREMSRVHSHPISSMAVNDDSRFLLTAGHNALKVWDYNLRLDINSQMFIGHSQPICQVSFTPDQMSVVSVGDAIFQWDFLAHHAPDYGVVTGGSYAKPVQTQAKVNGTQLANGMPRETVPQPSLPPAPNTYQTDQGAFGSLSLCEDPGSFPGGPPHGISFNPALDLSAAADALKVTEMTYASPVRKIYADKSEVRLPVRPDCYRHFIPRFKTSTLGQTAVAAQPDEACISLKAVVGYNGNGRGNMVWSPDQGLFVYSSGCVLVLELLHTGNQRTFRGHTEEISCIAITNDAKIMASAAGGSNSGKSLICVWDVQSGECQKTISHHRWTVQSLAFSRDNRFFLSIGDYTEPELALWCSNTFVLLSGISVSDPIHEAAFSPSAASQMACVGSQGLYFCHIQSTGFDVDLKIQRVEAPADVGRVELTALCYYMDSFLFTATNRGHVCVWDVNTQSCFMTWEADEGEIGVLLCRGNRLLTGSNTRWLRLWDVEAIRNRAPQAKVCSGGESETTVGLEQEIMLDGTTVSAAFDNTMVMGIIGTTAGTLWYINWSDNSSIRLVSGHKTKVNDVVFSPDESHFATCSEDGSLRVWSTPSNELVVQFQVLNQACSCVCWSHSTDENSASLAAGYSDGTLRIFRLHTSEMEMKLQPHQMAITAIQYSASGVVIISGAKNGLVAVSSLMSGATTRVIRDHRGAPVSNIQCVNQECMYFGPERKEMWLASSEDRRVSVWAADWSTEKCHLLDWLTFPAPALSEDDNPPPSLAAFCPTNPDQVVYTGYGVERELVFYSLSQKQIIKKINLPHWATCFSLSPKAPLIAVGSKERLLKLINLSDGKFQDYSQHSDSLQTCHFSPTGTLLFTAAYNEILLWEVHGV